MLEVKESTLTWYYFTVTFHSEDIIAVLKPLKLSRMQLSNVLRLLCLLVLAESNQCQFLPSGTGGLGLGLGGGFGATGGASLNSALLNQLRYGSAFQNPALATSLASGFPATTSTAQQLALLQLQQQGQFGGAGFNTFGAAGLGNFGNFGLTQGRSPAAQALIGGTAGAANAIAPAIASQGTAGTVKPLFTYSIGQKWLYLLQKVLKSRHGFP